MLRLATRTGEGGGRVCIGSGRAIVMGLLRFFCFSDLVYKVRLRLFASRPSRGLALEAVCAPSARPCAASARARAPGPEYMRLRTPSCPFQNPVSPVSPGAVTRTSSTRYRPSPLAQS